jgi:predicted phosphodiesterase
LGAEVTLAKKKPSAKKAATKKVAVKVTSKSPKLQPKSAEELIKEIKSSKDGVAGKSEDIVRALCTEIDRLKALSKKSLPKIEPRKGKAAKHSIIVVVPDSHGEHIDIPARNAFLRDLARIKPQRIVLLGDHLDAGGTFSTHQKSYTEELVESYDSDVAATNEFFDLMRDASPDSRWDYLEGNHEGHISRFIARNFQNHRDAKMVLDRLGPEAVLHLKDRECAYYKRSEWYQNISIPGTIRIGKVYFTHGIAAGKHATSTHLERFAASVFHGHTHRAQSATTRTVTSDGISAYCPGTLAKLQPLYAHTNPTGWSHGFGMITYNESTERFAAMLVPIVDGESMLITDALVPSG